MNISADQLAEKFWNVMQYEAKLNGNKLTTENFAKLPESVKYEFRAIARLVMKHCENIQCLAILHD